MALTYQSVQLDAVGGSGNPPVSSSFDATTSWGIPASGEYTITVTETVHGLGANVQVQVFELVGTDYQEVSVDVIVTATGDVNIKVNEVPDLRFEGKVVIVGE